MANILYIIYHSYNDAVLYCFLLMSAFIYFFPFVVSSTYFGGLYTFLLVRVSFVFCSIFYLYLVSGNIVNCVSHSLVIVLLTVTDNPWNPKVVKLALQWTPVIIMPHRIIWNWYTGRWWVVCYLWYSEEEPGWAPSPPRLLLAVPNVTAHPSTASVPIT